MGGCLIIDRLDEVGVGGVTFYNSVFLPIPSSSSTIYAMFETSSYRFYTRSLLLVERIMGKIIYKTGGLVA